MKSQIEVAHAFISASIFQDVIVERRSHGCNGSISISIDLGPSFFEHQSAHYPTATKPWTLICMMDKFMFHHIPLNDCQPLVPQDSAGEGFRPPGQCKIKPIEQKTDCG